MKMKPNEYHAHIHLLSDWQMSIHLRVWLFVNFRSLSLWCKYRDYKPIRVLLTTTQELPKYDNSLTIVLFSMMLPFNQGSFWCVFTGGEKINKGPKDFTWFFMEDKGSYYLPIRYTLPCPTNYYLYLHKCIVTKNQKSPPIIFLF